MVNRGKTCSTMADGGGTGGTDPAGAIRKVPNGSNPRYAETLQSTRPEVAFSLAPPCALLRRSMARARAERGREKIEWR